MPLSRFDKLLPWSGALAGLGFLAQELLTRTADVTGFGGKVAAGDAYRVYDDHLAQNVVSAACWALTAFGFFGFAVAVRAVLRSGEAGESSYSGLAHAGALASGVAAAFATCTYWMLEAAVGNEDTVSADPLNYLVGIAWIMLSICLVPLYWGVGLGGLRTRLLPRWFSIVTVVIAVLATLGASHIPPGGIVNYLLLPVWLVAASVILARRQRAGVAESLLTH